jgi:polyisoprenoid-binding protein YceI
MTITVPVSAIACEDEKMVEHLRVALKEKLHPDIAYQLVEYTLTGTDTARTTGKITIAGVTRPISFDVKLAPSPRGLRVVGETSIDMIQFAVTPPAIFEGMLKVGKDVRVRFDAVLQPLP